MSFVSDEDEDVGEGRSPLKTAGYVALGILSLGALFGVGLLLTEDEVVEEEQPAVTQRKPPAKAKPTRKQKRSAKAAAPAAPSAAAAAPAAPTPEKEAPAASPAKPAPAKAAPAPLVAAVAAPAAAAAAPMLPPNNRDLPMSDFVAMLNQMVEAFGGMEAELMARLRVDGAENMQEWIMGETQRVQDAIYTEYGIDQAGFKYLMECFGEKEAVKQCFTQMLIRQQALMQKLATLNAPPWYAKLVADQQALQDAPLSPCPRALQDPAKLQQILQTWSLGFMQSMNDAVEAVKRTEHVGEKEIFASGRLQAAVLEIFLPGFAEAKKQISRCHGAGLNEKDVEAAFMRTMPEQWMQLQMMIQKTMQNRFAKGLQLIMNPAGAAM